VDRLVAATFAAAHSSLDMAIKTAIHLAVVAVQLTLIGVFFMNLRGSPTLVRLAAAAGLYWLIIRFVSPSMITRLEARAVRAANPLFRPPMLACAPAP
jgi:caa(3)-type oxidase subunit IV